MKKLALGAAVAVALLNSAAHAAVTLDGAGKVVVTPADTYEIFLSGASALDNNIERLATSTTVVAAERLCDISQPIFKFQDAAGTGANQKAFLCTLNPLNPQLVGLAGGKTNVMIYKRNAGGSAMGVAPIIDDAKGLASASIEFMVVDPSLCSVPNPPPSAGAISSSNCTYSATTPGQFQKQKPDFGVSDVDPEQFRGVNTPSGFTGVNPSDLSSLKVDSAGGQVFGIVATLKLRNALQEAQFDAGSTCNPKNAGYTTGLNGTAESEACMPSLTRDQIASIFTGKLDSWNDLKIGANGLFAATTIAANKPAGGLPTVQPRVHLCTRNNGSGTKAQMGVNFLNYPCSAAATAPTGDTGTTPEVANQTQVHAMSSAGNVDECMDELDSGLNAGSGFNNTYSSRWALGIHGTERNANLSKRFRFIKIDGVAPTLENVTKGKYHDWAELTFQYANNHAFDAGEKAIVDEFIKAAGNPVVLASLNGNTMGQDSYQSWGRAGLLASPQKFTPDANGLLNAANPVNPYSHATTSSPTVNNCRVPAAYDLGTTRAIQLQ